MALSGTMNAISNPTLRKKLTDERNQKDAAKENKQPVEVKKYDRAAFRQPVASVSVKTDADGQPVKDAKGNPVAVVTLADGTTKEEPITVNTTITDSDGKEVAISSDGTMTPADGKPVTPPASAPVTNPANVGDGSLIVKFNPSTSSGTTPSTSSGYGQKFGFDGVEDGSGVWGRDNLKLGDKTYYVPIKSVQAGVEDVVAFDQQGPGAVTFTLESDGKSVAVQPEGNFIRVLAPYAGNYALFAKDDQGRVVGKLTILSYPMVSKNVVLVSLNNSDVPNPADLQTELNKIFAQGVASVNVKSEPVNLATNFYDPTKGVSTERSHYKYSSNMKSIVEDNLRFLWVHTWHFGLAQYRHFDAAQHRQCFC